MDVLTTNVEVMENYFVVGSRVYTTDLSDDELGVLKDLGVSLDKASCYVNGVGIYVRGLDTEFYSKHNTISKRDIKLTVKEPTGFDVTSGDGLIAPLLVAMLDECFVVVVGLCSETF